MKMKPIPTPKLVTAPLDEIILRSLVEQGFTTSHRQGFWCRVECPHCAPTVFQGKPSHEPNCPNKVTR